MSVSTTLPGWTPPETTPPYYEPVMVEDATLGLSIAELPGGRAILMWPIGASVHYVVLDAPMQALQDDIVTAPMIQTAFTAPHSVSRCAVWSHDGDVYFSVIHTAALLGVRGTVDIYKADDPSDPVTWSHHGNVWAGATIGTSIFFSADRGPVVGVPYVSSGGRWIYPGHRLYFNSNFGGFSGERASIWTSDDAGSSWTMRYDYGTGSVATSASWISPTIVRNPDDGYLYCAVSEGSPGGGGHGVYVIRSTDGGTTWADVVQTGERPHTHMVLDNGDDVFAVDGFASTGPFMMLDAGAWTFTGGELWERTHYSDESNGTRSHFSIIESNVFYCVSEFIGGLGQGWLIDSIGI